MESNWEDFFTNVASYIKRQTDKDQSPLEEMLHYIFGTSYRDELIFASRQFLIGYTDPEVDAALDSQLPQILSKALS